MQFEQTIYKDGKPVVTTVEYPSLESLQNWFGERFWNDPAVYAVMKTEYENGKTGFSMKNRHQKVIIKIKEKD